jgi:hypothetical protein
MERVLVETYGIVCVDMLAILSRGVVGRLDARRKLTIVNLISLAVDKYHVVGQLIVVLDDVCQIHARLPTLVHWQMMRSNERAIRQWRILRFSISNVDDGLPVRQELSDPVCRCLVFGHHRGDDRLSRGWRRVLDGSLFVFGWSLFVFNGSLFGEGFDIVQMRNVDLVAVRRNDEYDQGQYGASRDKSPQPWST